MYSVFGYHDRAGGVDATGLGAASGGGVHPVRPCPSPSKQVFERSQGPTGLFACDVSAEWEAGTAFRGSCNDEVDNENAFVDCPE